MKNFVASSTFKDEQGVQSQIPERFRFRVSQKVAAELKLDWALNWFLRRARMQNDVSSRL